MLTNDTYTESNQSGMDNTKQAALAFQLISNPELYVRMRDQSKVIDYRCWLADIMGIQADENEKKIKGKVIENLKTSEGELDEILKKEGSLKELLMTT